MSKEKEAVSASAAYQDSLDTLTRTFSGVKNNIMSELLPGMTSIMTGLSELLVGGKDAKDKIQSGAQEIVDKFAELFPKVSDILMTLILTAAEVAPELITSLVTGITANLPKIAASVGDIVMTFLTSLISSLPQFTSGALEVVLTLVEGIIDNLPKIIDAACQVIVSLANGLGMPQRHLWKPSVTRTVFFPKRMPGLMHKWKRRFRTTVLKSSAWNPCPLWTHSFPSLLALPLPKSR